MDVLRVLIAQASDPNSAVLAEKALDEYIASFGAITSKIGAIAILQDTLRPHQRVADGVQLQMIDLIYEYMDRQMRELREPS